MVILRIASLGTATAVMGSLICRKLPRDIASTRSMRTTGAYWKTGHVVTLLPALMTVRPVWKSLVTEKFVKEFSFDMPLGNHVATTLSIDTSTCPYWLSHKWLCYHLPRDELSLPLVFFMYLLWPFAVKNTFLAATASVPPTTVEHPRHCLSFGCRLLWQWFWILPAWFPGYIVFPTISINQSINQASIAQISPAKPGSVATAKSVFNSKIEETVP